MTTTFRDRASGKTRHNAWSYPSQLPKLDWQLFIRRLDTARTKRAIEKCHDVLHRVK